MEYVQWQNAHLRIENEQTQASQTEVKVGFLAFLHTAEVSLESLGHLQNEKHQPHPHQRKALISPHPTAVQSQGASADGKEGRRQKAGGM